MMRACSSRLSACKVISLSILQDALLLQDFQVSGLAKNTRQGLTDCDSWSACMWMPHTVHGRGRIFEMAGPIGGLSHA